MDCPACGLNTTADKGFVRGQHVFICTSCGQWLVEERMLRVIGDLDPFGPGHIVMDIRRQHRRLEDERLLNALEVG